MRIKNILVPIDFSECATNAMNYAARLARKFESKVMLLHVAESTVSEDETAFRQYKDDKLEAIEKMTDQDPAFANIISEVKIDNGELKDSVLSMIDEFCVDMVVMGTEGAHGVIDELKGSHTYEILKDSKVPLSIVPVGVRYREPAKIGFATDLKDVEHSLTMDVLLDFTYAFNAELDIFHIRGSRGENPDEQYFVIKELDEYFSGVDHRFFEIEDDNIAEGIDRFVRSNNIDMLAIMPRRHSLLEQVSHESTTKKVAHHTGLPLLTFHE